MLSSILNPYVFKNRDFSGWVVCLVDSPKQEHDLGSAGWCVWDRELSGMVVEPGMVNATQITIDANANGLGLGSCLNNE